MAVRAVLAFLHLQTSNESVLQVAGDLGELFDAHMIGVAASQPTPIMSTDGLIPGSFIERDHPALLLQIAKAESEFWTTLRSRTKSLEWKSDVIYDSLTNHVSRLSRGADVVVTSRISSDASQLGPFEDPSSLILQAGRPVLLVPDGAEKLRLKNVILAWKDTREARRAALDAIPFFEKAGKVTVVEVAAAYDHAHAQARVTDVVAWLDRHGVAADSTVIESDGGSAFQLGVFARDHAADLIVAGAYGHNRLREWVFGSVTHDIVHESKNCVLVSH